MGERKAKLFSSYANVTVVSKAVTPELERMGEEGYVKLVRADVSQVGTGEQVEAGELMRGAFIVIPATDNLHLNRSIEKEAEDMGILVNKVNEIGDVVVPSVIRRGAVNVAISTQGQSPALSKYLRLQLEEGELSRNYGEMAELLGSVRAELKQIVPHQRDRKKILWKIISDDNVWNLLDVSYEKAYKKAREHLIPDERDSLDADNPP